MKLQKDFYQRPALEIAKEFLGKYLVYNSPHGKISGKIIDVEAYPAFVDDVSHGNKKTKRTKVLWYEGGYVYIYLIYGKYYQFAVVVNKKDIPEVVFIRTVLPAEGINIMRKNFGKEVVNDNDLTKSPGNLCKAFGFTLELYGEDLTGHRIWLEDRGETALEAEIRSGPRIGINSKRAGSETNYRYYIS